MRKKELKNERMLTNLVLKEKVKVRDLEKYGFKILCDEKELEKNMEKDSLEFYCNMAVAPLGNHFNLVVENDLYYRELTIVPEHTFGLNMCLTHHLGLLYELIKDGLVERVDFEE